MVVCGLQSLIFGGFADCNLIFQAVCDAESFFGVVCGLQSLVFLWFLRSAISYFRLFAMQSHCFLVVCGLPESYFLVVFADCIQSLIFWGICGNLFGTYFARQFLARPLPSK